MAEFRNATSEFKSTWEKEVSFEENEENEEKSVAPLTNGNQISRDYSSNQNQSAARDEEQFPKPSIKELSAADIAEKFDGDNNLEKNSEIKEKALENGTSDKRDWL